MHEGKARAPTPSGNVGACSVWRKAELRSSARACTSKMSDTSTESACSLTRAHRDNPLPSVSLESCLALARVQRTLNAEAPREATTWPGQRHRSPSTGTRQEPLGRGWWPPQPGVRASGTRRRLHQQNQWMPDSSDSLSLSCWIQT